jgi:hypothetical protein
LAEFTKINGGKYTIQGNVYGYMGGLKKESLLMMYAL